MRTSKRFRRSVALAVVIGAVVGVCWLLPSRVTTSILVGVFAVLSVLIELLLEFAVTLLSENEEGTDVALGSGYEQRMPLVTPSGIGQC